MCQMTELNKVLKIARGGAFLKIFSNMFLIFF